ncbi:MAG: fumarylacetoacetate hydrolase family protein [Chloroflexota bacterium]|jgi:2-dehydro-3-deoxy-D-arabinonate dehydratase
MSAPILVRYYHPESGRRLGLQLEDTVHDITQSAGSISAWLRSSVNRVESAIEDLVETAYSSSNTYPASTFANPPSSSEPHWLAPVDDQDVWASGVTYSRSRKARQEEAVDGGDVYARVYAADRPELFFKARGPWVVGPYDQVGIRQDADWSVPEPELGLVLNPALEIVGLVIGNDVSSRDIEGANPLYLPQAKIYTASCSLGPGLILEPFAGTWPKLSIQAQIRRDDALVFQGQTHTDQIRRRPEELIDYLGRALQFPDGVVLLSGTGIVPPDDFTLAAGDVVQIQIEDLGTLENSIKVV